MSSFSLSGGVEVLGFISPTDTNDTYAVIDPLYGIDGWRNVNNIQELNSIPNLRRRAGMIVGVSGGTQYYKLKQSPWSGNTNDWEIFSLGSTFTGGTITGDTIFTNQLTANILSATTYLNLPLDVFVTGGTYQNGTATFRNNNGGSFTVTGFYTGETTFVRTLLASSGLSANTTSGNVSIVNTAPDRVVVLNNGTGILTSGTYPNFTITNTSPNQIVTLSGGTGILTGGTYPNFTIANTLPDLVVNITDGTGISTTGTYPNFTIVNTLPDLNVTLTGGTNIEVTGSYPNFGVNYTGQTEFPYLPLTGGTITGNTNVDGTFVTTTISATTYQNLPSTVDTFVTGFSYNNNTFTINRNQSLPDLNATINTVTGLTINGNLVVTGTTLVNTLTGTTAVLSGSGQNILTIFGSGSTQPIVSVQGSFGELFTIYDNLIGSLFSVNNISGLPVLDVFSDNTILMGDYVSPSLNTTTRVLAGVGTTNIYSIPTSAYTGAFFDYTVSDGTNLRAGNIMSIWSGSSVNFTETSTTDFGSTTGLTFNMAVSSGNAVLQTSGVTGSWTVKTIVRSI